MKDAYGRKIEYLRISLTDKCNLRCKYCMPAEGIGLMKHSEVLTLEEICRTARVLTEMGVCRIRLTGGEPLVRRGIVGLMQSLQELPAHPELAMTTNGVLLADRLEELVSVGLQSVNISLDTRNRDVYRELTGTDGFEAVERSIDLALQMGLPVKLNCVPIRGINDGELADLAEYARDRKIDVRFIELMPMGCAREYRGVSEAEILEMLEKRFGEVETLTEQGTDAYSMSGHTISENTASQIGMVSNDSNDASGPSGYRGPARYVHFRGFQGRVGFISPLSHAFCSECNRLRLTVDGRLKLCLYYPEGLDVRQLLRSGCTDEELMTSIRGIIMQKPERHEFCETKSAKERRSMYEIGG